MRGEASADSFLPLRKEYSVSVRMRGEASADLCWLWEGEKSRFSPHARGSVGRPSTSPPSAPPPCFSPHARGSVGRQARLDAARKGLVSVRMRGEASADRAWPDGRALGVSVRMRGEASADRSSTASLLSDSFQSACAGKRRQTPPLRRSPRSARVSVRMRGEASADTPIRSDLSTKRQFWYISTDVD